MLIGNISQVIPECQINPETTKIETEELNFLLLVIKKNKKEIGKEDCYFRQSKLHYYLTSLLFIKEATVGMREHDTKLCRNNELKFIIKKRT